MTYKFLFLFLLSSTLIGGIKGQNSTYVPYKPEMLVELPTTSVKNQSITSTCWSFATISFLESEIIRKTGKIYDLSEMHVVRNVYIDKARKYIRMHGTINFAAGGEANDVMNALHAYGIVEEDYYSGLQAGRINHNHTKLDEELKLFVDSIVSLGNVNEEIWLPGFNSLLNEHLGEVPNNIQREVKSLEDLGLSIEDYVYLTSFTHHPYYSTFILEVPDNWSWHSYFNVPPDVLKQAVDSALFKGYSVTWASDYSEIGFLFNEGVAVAPKEVYSDMKEGFDLEVEKNKEQHCEERYSNLKIPVKECAVSKENRQKGFDSYATTDDHLMHIIGKAEGVEGKQYFYVKNSWGVRGKFDGFFFVSEPYFMLKTVSVMLHKESLPQNLKKKLFLEN